MPAVQQCCLSILGNLLTDAFDPAAVESLARFSASEGLEKVLKQLQVPGNNVYAAVCLQNLSALDPQATSDRLRELGALKLLEPLCRSDDEEVRRLTWHET